MAKKARVHNSPFDRDFEKIRDIRRWEDQGIVYALGNGEYAFSKAFADAVRREILTTRSANDAGFDDGTPRRWVTLDMTQQLKPVSEVGTMKGITRNPDKLRRRVRNGKPITITAKPQEAAG